MAANTARTIQLATTPAERIVQHVEVSHAAMEKAAAFQADVEQKQKTAQSKIAATCDALIANGRVRAEQRTKLAEALQDHASTLDLLAGLASHRTSDEAGRLGQGQAGAGSTKIAGQSSTADRPFSKAAAQKASSAALFRGLGLPVPSDI